MTNHTASERALELLGYLATRDDDLLRIGADRKLVHIAVDLFVKGQSCGELGPSCVVGLVIGRATRRGRMRHELGQLIHALGVMLDHAGRGRLSCD